jgi:hypothetical protein
VTDYSSNVFLHEALIKGHAYSYKVLASNLMGYGEESAVFTFTPRSVPARPARAPRNLVQQTTRSQIHIEYDAVSENGGSELLRYNIYMDDGMDGDFLGPFENGPTLTTWNSDGITLTAGRIYKLKFSSTNVHGESELSDEVSILAAEVPSPPSSV